MGVSSMEDKCSACGTNKKLQEHHISYDPEIKITLCASCHIKTHGSKHGTGKGNDYRPKSEVDLSIMGGRIHPNGQITVPKLKRDELNIEDGDTIYFKIFKVIDNNGVVRYEKEKEVKVNGHRSEIK